MLRCDATISPGAGRSKAKIADSQLRIDRSKMRLIFEIVGKFGSARKGKMARVTGLEPAASGVTGRRSNQLSYTRATNRVAVAVMY